MVPPTFAPKVTIRNKIRGAVREMVFAVADSQGTKAPTPVTSLSKFNVTVVKNDAEGNLVTEFTNAVFSKSQDGKYRGGKVWPVEDRSYRFYASNVSMTHNLRGELVTVSSIDTDVVCAYLASPLFGETNTLVFQHILSRVGKVTFGNLSSCTDVSLSMRYRGSGTYNMKNGAWTNLGAEQTKTLTTSDNNFWIIPGTYQITLSYTDGDGVPQTKTVSQTFGAGLVNDINASLGDGVVVRTETEYEAPMFVLGTVNDIPASGGTVTANPSITNVTQRTRQVSVMADGSRTYSSWTTVSPSFAVAYCKTRTGAFSSSKQSFSASSLGTVVTDRTKKGDLYVRVTANGVAAIMSAEVFQQANARTVTSVSCDVGGSDNMPASLQQVDWVAAGGGHLTLYAYAACTYTSGASNQVDVSSSATFSIGSYNNCGATVSGRGITVPSRGTVTGAERYSVFRASYGGFTSSDRACGQEANASTLLAAATDVTALSIALSPDFVASMGGTSSVTGTLHHTVTTAKYGYTSGATSGGSVSESDSNVALSVSASPTTGLSVSGQTLTVAANNSVSNRTWTITGTNGGRSATATLTQSGKNSWGVVEEDED